MGNQVFFIADDGQSCYELWRSDGTPAGTVKVAEINPGRYGGYPGGFALAVGSAS